MSNLQSSLKKKPIAILCGDIHLSHNAPKNRAEKKHNWYKAMAQSLYQLRVKQEEHQCPIIIAGDIFDKWDSPAELINFAIKEMPDEVHAIPGQHDLPNHRHDLIHKSAYWTLVESGKIENIPVGESYVFKPEKLDVIAYPWNVPLSPYGGDCPHKDFLKLAVIHRYCYKNINGHNSGYKGAPQEAEIQQQVKKLKGFDAAVFGDNHTRWFYKGENINVVNCGTFMRRSIKDKDITPNVAYLYSDGRIHIDTIDTDDKWLDAPINEELTQNTEEITKFVHKLLKAETDSINFREIVEKACAKKGVSQEVKEIILESLE